MICFGGRGGGGKNNSHCATQKQNTAAEYFNFHFSPALKKALVMVQTAIFLSNEHIIQIPTEFSNHTVLCSRIKNCAMKPTVQITLIVIVLP